MAGGRFALVSFHGAGATYSKEHANSNKNHADG